MIIVAIHNDGTGTEQYGNYNVKVFLPGDGWIRSRVEGWERSAGWAGLVEEAVAELDKVNRERVA